jgi:hypothetical protein
MNAFRILRISSSASLSDIHKAAASMRRAASLGIVNTTESDLPPLGDVGRTEADIRAAVGRLENPVQRLSERIFWFHQPPGPSSAPLSPPKQESSAAQNHDMALHQLFVAMQAGNADSGLKLWGGALRAWYQVISSEDYCLLNLTLEERGAFEPPALRSEVEDVLAAAVGLAAEPLLVDARDALARDDAETVRRIIGILGSLSDTGSWAASAQSDIAAPDVEHFRALCRSVREDHGSTIIREQNSSKHNRSICDAELKHFRDKIEPALDRLGKLLPTDHEVSRLAREEAALCLNAIASDFTWADDFITSEKLSEEAHQLAKDTLGAIRIEAELTQIRELARKQRVFGALTPISSAPSLSTYNGFGFSVYGNSDHDPDTNSYVATHYFVALFIPIFPLARYRVIKTANGFKFLGKLPLRRFDRWHLGIMMAAIATVSLVSYLNSATNSASSYTPSSSYTPPPKAPASGSNRAISSSAKTQLSAIKARIDAGRRRTI